SIRYNTVLAEGRRDNRTLVSSYANVGCRVAHTYESQSVLYKTWWGDQFGGGSRTARLFELYPDLIIYHDSLRQLAMATVTLDSGQIDEWVRKQKCMYLISSSSARFPPEALGLASASI